MKRILSGLLSVAVMAALLLWTSPVAAQGVNLLQNGSLELLGSPQRWDGLPGWVQTGTVLWSAGGFQTQDGINCVGVISGQFYQDVSTVLGQTYQLSFYVAGSAPDGPLPVTHNLSVLWNGELIGTTSFDSTGKTFTDMGWSYRSFLVQGTGGATRLAFANPNSPSGPNTPVFDNVQLVAIPEPSCIALLGFAGMLIFSRSQIRHRGTSGQRS